MTKLDWNPKDYARFAGVRLQPALDLLAAVGDLPAGGLVDLGCGSGVMGPALAARYPARQLVGLDSSAAMLGKAGQVAGYDVLQEADIVNWQPQPRQALIFSNAVLQWLPDHAELLPRLSQALLPGGVLAVQLPHQQQAPSGMGWAQAYDALFEQPPTGKQSEVLTPEGYFDLLSPLGKLRLWETEYYQHLAPSEAGHPVRLYTESTFGRPFLEALSPLDQGRLTAAYDGLMEQAYPRRSDGSVLFPFRRMFFVLEI